MWAFGKYLFWEIPQENSSVDRYPLKIILTFKTNHYWECILEDITLITKLVKVTVLKLKPKRGANGRKCVHLNNYYHKYKS